MAGTDVLKRFEAPGRMPSRDAWAPRFRRALWWMHQSLWLLPVLGAVAGALLALVLVHPQTTSLGWLRGVAWRATPSEARQVLSTVLGIALTTLSIILSLTMLVVQNTGGSYSPRLMRLLLASAGMRVVLPVYVATCSFCMVAVHDFGFLRNEASQPRPALSMAMLLLILCVVALLFQVLQTLQFMRVENLVRLVARNTLDIASRLDERREHDLPVGASVPRLPEQTWPLRAPADGFVVDVDAAALLTMASEHDLVIHVDTVTGAPVLRGSILGRVGAEPPGPPDLPHVLENVTAGILTDKWRSPDGDVALGFRQLVDMAIKALSPGINDPYTAVEALDQLTVLLCGLCRMRLGPRVLADPRGRARVLIRTPTLSDCLDLATDQIARYGAGEPAVVLHLMRLTGEVARHVRTEDERNAARGVLRSVLATAERTMQDPARLEQLRQYARATEYAMDGGPFPPLPVIGF
ncbi:DUF2254 domain-containing protein [Pyxidicoccus sp. 3LG]